MRCPKICFAVKCFGASLRSAASSQQSRAIKLNMKGSFSFILIVVFLLSSSLTDANELQSNTSTSKCEVDTKFRLRTIKLLASTEQGQPTDRFCKLSVHVRKVFNPSSFLRIVTSNFHDMNAYCFRIDKYFVLGTEKKGQL